MNRKHISLLTALTAILLLAVAFFLSSDGWNQLFGCAGCIPTTSPGVADVAANSLVVDAAEAQPACGPATFRITLRNTSTDTNVSDVVVEVTVTDGAEYIAQAATTRWRAGTLKAGQSKSISMRITTNDAWTTAAAGEKIVIQATIRPEGNLGMLSISRPDEAAFLTPGNCAPIDITPTPEPIKTPAASCKSWYIFHSSRSGNLDLFRLDGIEGRTGVRTYNLSNNEAQDRNPSRTYDGLWIVYESNRGGNWDIFLADAVGDNLRQATTSDASDTNAVFGPDARTIAFQSNRNGNWDIYLYDRISRSESQLTKGEADEINAAWAPHGRSIVFQVKNDKNWDIAIVDVRSGEVRPLVNTDADEISPIWSPNGQYIAFITVKDGKPNLHVIDASGENEKALTTNGAVLNPAWSPDSASIAYEATVDGNTDIYIYRLRTNQETRLTNAPGKDQGPTWDCLGLNILYTGGDEGETDIYQVPVSGGTPTQMTNHAAEDSWPLLNNGKNFAAVQP